MNFFKRLFLKLEKKAEARLNKSETPPQVAQQQAPAPVAPVPMATPPVPQARIIFTADETDYLSRYPDVARHVDPDPTKPSYSRAPYQHWLDHGQKEGRTWGAQAPKVPDVLTPENAHLDERLSVMGYLGIMAPVYGKADLWKRVSGTFPGTGSQWMMTKFRLSHEGVAAMVADRSKWPEIARAYFSEYDPGTGTQSGWAAWEEKFKQQVTKPPKGDEEIQL